MARVSSSSSSSSSITYLMSQSMDLGKAIPADIMRHILVRAKPPGQELACCSLLGAPITKQHQRLTLAGCSYRVSSFLLRYDKQGITTTLGALGGGSFRTSLCSSRVISSNVWSPECSVWSLSQWSALRLLTMIVSGSLSTAPIS